MHSAIYRGWLDHRRVTPRVHAFRYPLFMMYLDLDELDRVFRGRWLWSTRRPALAWFRRADHLGDPAVPLAVAVRDLVEERTGQRPDGPIRLLTHLRYAGYGFNPVSFYYCFERTGEAPRWIVAEVHNTPWGERHCYVLDQPVRGGTAAGVRHYRSDKAMHVSPFMPMALSYDWGFNVPGQSLRVDMVLRARDGVGEACGAAGDTAGVAAGGTVGVAEGGTSGVAAGGDQARPAPVFAAVLTLQREPVTAAALAAVLVRHPLMTVKVIAAIHWEALRLWCKRIPIHDHPRRGHPIQDHPIHDSPRAGQEPS